MRRRGKATASATALAAGVLTIATACGGSPAADPSSPTPLSSSPTTTATSASPTPTASSTLDPNSDAAILAAVQAYANAVTEVARTGSLTPLSTAATQGCPCFESASSLVQQLQTKQEHLDVVFIAAGPRILRKSATNADVQITLTNAAFHVLNKAGQPIEPGKAASIPTVLSLQREGARWLVFYVDSPH